MADEFGFMLESMILATMLGTGTESAWLEVYGHYYMESE